MKSAGDDDSIDTDQAQKKGRLSSRMLIPGNTWQTVWEAAKPVSARRQVHFFRSFFYFELLIYKYCWHFSETFIR